MITYQVRVIEGTWDERGRTEWTLNGSLHREDGPAIVYDNGDKEWYLFGKAHRENGPAHEYVFPREGHE